MICDCLHNIPDSFLHGHDAGALVFSVVTAGSHGDPERQVLRESAQELLRHVTDPKAFNIVADPCPEISWKIMV
jgi:predicted secreted protein